MNWCPTGVTLQQDCKPKDVNKLYKVSATFTHLHTHTDGSEVPCKVLAWPEDISTSGPNHRPCDQ